MSEALRSRKPDQLTPYEALLRGFAYFQRIDQEEHAIVRAALERAVEQAPGYADAWAMLSILYREEYTHGFNPLPDPLGRAFAAARRAIEAAPSNHYGYHALGLGVVSSAGKSRPFGVRLSGRSRSTPWTDSPSLTWVFSLPIPATGSAAAL